MPNRIDNQATGVCLKKAVYIGSKSVAYRDMLQIYIIIRREGHFAQRGLAGLSVYGPEEHQISQS